MFLQFHQDLLVLGLHYVQLCFDFKNFAQDERLTFYRGLFRTIILICDQFNILCHNTHLFTSSPNSFASLSPLLSYENSISFLVYLTNRLNDQYSDTN